MTPAVAAVSRKALVLSAARLIDTAGVTEPELPTMTGNRESEVYAAIGISSRLRFF